MSDDERVHCVKEVLRTNPNNETAKKKLDELTNYRPVFPTQEPIPATSNELSEPLQKIEKKGYSIRLRR